MRQRRELTVDGFEMDFGTNFLGHYALNGLLLGAVTAAEAGRFVTVGSKVYRAGLIDFDDLTMDRGFTAARAYSRAKFAQLVYAVELQRRLTRAGQRALSVAAHPGATQSGVMRDQNALLQWLFTTPSLRWLRRTFIMEASGGRSSPCVPPPIRRCSAVSTTARAAPSGSAARRSRSRWPRRPPTRTGPAAVGVRGEAHRGACRSVDRSGGTVTTGMRLNCRNADTSSGKRCKCSGRRLLR